MADHQGSPFLTLPGELRNRIYRFILVQPPGERVQLRVPSDFTGPGLLTTCKQIRVEAQQIYYSENTFMVTCTAWNSDLPVLWNRKAKQIGKESGLERQRLAGHMDGLHEANWNNLIVWLQRYHAGTVTSKTVAPSRMPQDHQTARFVISGMFRTVDIMKGKPWTEVLKELEEQRYILRRVDSRW